MAGIPIEFRSLSDICPSRKDFPGFGKKISVALAAFSVTSRYLAAIVGSLISFMPGMGDICLLMTRCLQQQITRKFQSGWDYEFLVDNNALSELDSGKIILLL